MALLGEIVAGWTPPPRPGPAAIDGRRVRLERLDPGRHAAGLFAAFAGADAVWDYLPYGPFRDLAAYRAWLDSVAGRPDPYFYALCDAATGAPAGVASYLRIDPANGVIEVGHINLSPRLQKSPAATEAMALMMGWAFDAGYRRYEWKCNALNLGSRRAAERLGMSFEGVFRQAAVVKGRNRDTAWFALIDKDWPRVRAAFAAWLDPSNFDARGQQRQRLSDLTEGALVSRDPARSAS
jgi:RimJ/RimL family protein N-acetyltransferase